MPRKYSDRDIKLLFSSTGGICSFPDCQRHCLESATTSDPTAVLGEISHIVAHGKTGPRADPTYPRNKLNTFENLLLLCPTHHSLVDKQPNTYTCADLRAWKTAKEKWFKDTFTASMTRVSFHELEVVIKGLLSTAPQADTFSASLTPLREKMDRNSLTRTDLLHIGLLKRHEVEKYVQGVALVDPGFQKRLKAGFVVEYHRLVGEGLKGDDLFDALRRFAAGARHDILYQAAALAVLCFMFELCEVFER